MDHIELNGGYRNPFILSEEEKRREYSDTLLVGEGAFDTENNFLTDDGDIHIVEVPELNTKATPTTHRTTTMGLGMLNAITGFYNLYFWSKRVVHSIKHYDFESKIEAFLRVLCTPLAMANAIESIVLFASAFFKGLVVVGVSLSALLLGAVFLAVEAGLEIYRLFEMYRFKKNIDFTTVMKHVEALTLPKEGTDLEKLKTIEAYVKDNYEDLKGNAGSKAFERLERVLNETINGDRESLASLDNALLTTRICLMQARIQLVHKEYFTLTAREKIQARIHAKKIAKKDTQHSEKDLVKIIRERRLDGKVDKLARRIGSGMITKLKDHDLKIQASFNTKMKREVQMLESDTKRLFHDLKEKNDKAILVHSVGLAAVLLGFVLITLSYLVAPPLAMIGTGLVVTVMQTGRFLAPRSFIDQDGYKFTLRPWIEDVKRVLGITKKRTYEFIPMKTFKTNAKQEDKSSVAMNETDTL